MTREQVIQNSMWIVNTVLKEQKLQLDDDLRQDACLYLIKCYDRFDSSKGVKWSTYAYKSIYLYVLRVNAKNKAVENKCEHNEVPILNRADKDMEEQVATTFLLKEIRNFITPEEKKIFDLLYKGYSAKQISKMINKSYTYVLCLVKNIKWKASKLNKPVP